MDVAFSRIIFCATVQHDWRLMAVAILVCALGLASALGLTDLASQAKGRRRRLTALMAASVAGLAVWTTHFLAMLAYQPGVVVRYDLAGTLISLVIAIAGLAACVAVAMHGRDRLHRGLAAACAVAAVAGMHFVGVSAAAFTGARLFWDPGMVVLAIGLGVAVAAVIVLPPRLKDPWRLVWITGVASSSVLALHLGGMAAMRITPDPAVLPEAADLSGGALLALVAIGAAVIVAVAAAVAAVSFYSRSQALNRLREAIDAMPDGLAFFDAEDRLLVWNARYAEVNPELVAMLTPGMTFAEIVRLGMGEGVYVEAAGREEEWIANRLAARQGLSSSLEQKLAGDRWLRVQDRRTAAGGVVTVCNDITDLKRDAQALAEARDAAEAANRAKSEFLANMSHEIRTPLNGVLGLAQALARTDLTPDQTEMLTLIQSSGETLQTLLSDLLDLARVESGRMEIAQEPFDLARAVQDAAQLYATSAAEKGLQFFVDVEPEASIWIHGDIVRVKQVLTNLVSNAVKFTAQGFVSLTVARCQGAGREAVRFTVEDTGVGFDSETRDRLFSRFEQADGTITRRFGGTGLGLAICRELADRMGGHLDCESEPGGGSAFIFTLPLAVAAKPEPKLAEVADVVGERRLRVLVADDHPTNRRVVELILAQADVALTSVEDGAQALAACRASAFDLVLMDMQMPVMDGLTAVREIRLHETAMGFARTPIVMLTANALAEHVTASEVAGADHHLAKPFNAAELLAVVQSLSSDETARAAA